MDFTPIARYYDTMAKLVFGNSIVTSQTNYFSEIKRNVDVLIVGGGSGWILEYLPPFCKSVTYVDASEGMISLAQRRALPFDVEFISQSIFKTRLSKKFDVIITNFFLDLFHEKELNHVCKKINLHLNKQGFWIVTDFSDTTAVWQKALLRSMYIFFGVVAGLSTSKISDWDYALRLQNLNPVRAEKFYGDFITAAVYKKTQLPI